MSKFENHIDSLITKILNEEIETKVKTISEEMGEWQEIHVDEDLKGGQKKLDVAPPKGKLTAADFKKLRSKKKETKELFFYDDESVEDAEEKSQDEPTYVGKGLADNKMKAELRNKIFGSFSDEHGWFDDRDTQFKGDFDFDYEEEVFPSFDSLMSKYGKKQRWFAPNDGERFFRAYQDKFGGAPFRVRKMRDLGEEAETEEGNEFTGELEKARKEGKPTFKVGKKTFKTEPKEKRDNFDGRKSEVIGVYSDINKQREMKEEKKWIQKTDMKKGALHKKLEVPQDEKIPQAKLKSLKKELMKKAEGDKKLSASDSKLLKQVNLALTLKGIKESSNKISFTEDELIDFIENIVVEQKVKDKDEKENISKKKPEGLKKTEKALAGSKKENEDYAKEVVKKMKDYVKKGSNGEFKENPEEFPESNYDLSGMKEKTKKYHPSDSVDEYIDAFAYPGQTNLVFDEIKPDDEKIEMFIKGDSKTGNAQKDKDGKALGNVVPSEVGEKFMKNYKENLYGAEQMNASYKRQPQPIETAGEEKTQGGLSKFKGSSSKKASSILNKLESIEDKKLQVVSEEMKKMKNLITYNRKTQ